MTPQEADALVAQVLEGIAPSIAAVKGELAAQEAESARLRARLAEVEGAAAEWERKAAVVSEGPPSMETLFRGAIKATYAECAAALRAVLPRTEGPEVKP